MRRKLIYTETIYRAFLIFAPLALISCAHDPDLSAKINADAQRQPTVNAAVREEEGRKAIEAAPLTAEQKAKLDSIADATSIDLRRTREEEARLRLLLVKQLVNPAASDREIEGIKQRILELNQQNNKRWLSALDEARQVIGRRNEQDARFYRAFLQEPLPHDNGLGGRMAK